MLCFATVLCGAVLHGGVVAAEEGVEAGGAETSEAASPLFTADEWERAAERSQGVGAGRDRRGQPMEDGQMTASLLRMAFALVMVVALAIAAAYLAKRFGLHRRLPGQRGQHMEVLESLPIGPKRMVTLLRINGHHVVIGHGEHAIASLASFPVTSASDPAAAVSPEGPVSAASPGEAGDSYGGGLPGSVEQSVPHAAPPLQAESPANVDDFRHRLNRLLGRQG